MAIQEAEGFFRANLEEGCSVPESVLQDQARVKMIVDLVSRYAKGVDPLQAIELPTSKVDYLGHKTHEALFDSSFQKIVEQGAKGDSHEQRARFIRETCVVIAVGLKAQEDGRSNVPRFFLGAAARRVVRYGILRTEELSGSKVDPVWSVRFCNDFLNGGPDLEEMNRFVENPPIKLDHSSEKTS